MSNVTLKVKSKQIEAPVGTTSVGWVFKVVDDKGNAVGSSDIQVSNSFTLHLEDGSYNATCQRVDKESAAVGDQVSVAFKVAPDAIMVTAADSMTVTVEK